MYRVVLDTNILISGLIWRGIPGKAVDAATQYQFRLLLSASLVQELQVTLYRPKFTKIIAASGQRVDDMIGKVIQASIFVPSAEVPDDVVRDPKDRHVLACALGGNADCIVTGDADLLTLGSYARIPIWKVAHFMEQLAEED
jgi:putative PIN family toxin of toxin-antitoxin system